MKDLNKLALILRALGFRAGTEAADDEFDHWDIGECYASKGEYNWDIWKCATDELYEVQMYSNGECIYDGVMCDSLFDVVYAISTAYYEYKPNN